MKLRRIIFRPILVLAIALIMTDRTFAYYDPGVQRWINRDPAEEQADKNLFLFLKNAPPGSVDAFGLVVATPIVLDVAECRDIMERAFNAAQNTQASLNDRYTCGCANGKEITPNEAMPGNGLGHCLVGYYAKQYGATRRCLAAANAAFETWELKLMEWRDPGEWIYDTIRDILHTFRGYGKNSPEGCLPANCKMRN